MYNYGRKNFKADRDSTYKIKLHSFRFSQKNHDTFHESVCTGEKQESKSFSIIRWSVANYVTVECCVTQSPKRCKLLLLLLLTWAFINNIFSSDFSIHEFMIGFSLDDENTTTARKKKLVLNARLPSWNTTRALSWENLW